MKPESRIHSLTQIAEGLARGHTYSTTRLTTLKPLCAPRQVALAFAWFAVRVAGHRAKPPVSTQERELLRAVRARLRRSTGPARSETDALLDRLVGYQSQHVPLTWGSARVITSRPVLIAEKALTLAMASTPEERGARAYDLAATLTRRNDPRYGTGLIPESAESVRQLAQFFHRQCGGA